MSKAPWNDEQVTALNAWQESGQFHPFTCGKRDTPGHLLYAALHLEKHGRHVDVGQLVATHDGWVCPVPTCDYTQNWAHDFMEKPMPHSEITGAAAHAFEALRSGVILRALITSSGHMERLHRRLTNCGRFPMWVVCLPITREYYGYWVARMHVTLPSPKPTRFVITHDTLDELRAILPRGLVNIGRHRDDLPEIEEVWL